MTIHTKENSKGFSLLNIYRSIDNLSNDDNNVLMDFEDEVMKLYNVMEVRYR